MLNHGVLKIFTAFYVLTGIGILVEVARQLGIGFVKMREEYKATMPSSNTSRTVGTRTIRPKHNRRNNPRASGGPPWPWTKSSNHSARGVGSMEMRESAIARFSACTCGRVTPIG